MAFLPILAEECFFSPWATALRPLRICRFSGSLKINHPKNKTGATLAATLTISVTSPKWFSRCPAPGLRLLLAGFRKATR
jgi:hypothetical protein